MWTPRRFQGYHVVAFKQNYACHGGNQIMVRGFDGREQPKWTRMSALATASAIVFFTILIIAITRLSFWTSGSNILLFHTTTSTCLLRHEWRHLSTIEQQAYIQAVQCLLTLNSSLAVQPNMTAYDDFPWIHSRVGYFTHNSAAFLPWHRYFLHIYETTLRGKCNYQGSLVYWDWTLDYAALEKSPVFDPLNGLGGDGEVNGEVVLGSTGRCVVDGPFAGLEVNYYDVEYQPHCLSRGFRNNDGKLGHIDGEGVSPASIEEVLRMETYEEFVELMEVRVHDTIPMGIGGDFETFTAPYDPLFYLHHVQLDRLWWMWQQKQPNKGVLSYGGRKERYSSELASLEDYLFYGGLDPSVKVADVMDAQGEALCYRY